MIDYFTGLFLVASPLFGFSDRLTPVWIAVLTAVAISSMSLCTKYKAGFIHVIPMKLHLQFDIATGLFLILSPWLFSFSGSAVWVFIIAGMFTQTMPYHPRKKMT